jgi:hypothetical protein
MSGWWDNIPNLDGSEESAHGNLRFQMCDFFNRSTERSRRSLKS